MTGYNQSEVLYVMSAEVFVIEELSFGDNKFVELERFWGCGRLIIGRGL